MVNHPDNDGPDFPGKEPSERYRFYIRQHWIRLVPAFAKAFGWTALLFLSSVLSYMGLPLDDTTRHFILVPLSLIFVFFQMQVMRRWYEYFLHVIIVTDVKIHRMKKRFMLMEEERSIDIPSIKDIKREQHGAIQAVFGFGTLVLDTAQGELFIHFTPDMKKVHDALVAHKEETAPKEASKQLLEDVKSAVETLQPYTEK